MSTKMNAIDRRTALRGILYGAMAATAGLAIIPDVAESAPIARDGVRNVNAEGLVQEAQVVVVDPRRRRGRRRRWV